MNRALRPSHDPFYALLRPAYPGALERAVILSLTQVLWDRGEANGYALHMTRAPYLDTPRHTVLLHEAFGDHQVANVATETEARTIGARLRTPAVDPGRSLDREPFFGIRPIRNYPWGGNALVVWDIGSLRAGGLGTPPPPTTNTPPRLGVDPHAITAAARGGRPVLELPEAGWRLRGRVRHAAVPRGRLDRALRRRPPRGAESVHMIASVRGSVILRRSGEVVVEAAGVGYRLAVSAETLREVPAAGEEVELHAHLVLRDDGIQLYGFASETERDLFLMLIGVQGVGPKVALAVLSGGSSRELVSAIAAGDSGRFQAVQGIGKRTAERIIVELREKVAGAVAEEIVVRRTSSDDPRSLAREGLLGLGFGQQEAEELLDDAEGDAPEELIAAALRAAR